jgi:hypothetical protein
MKSEQSDTILCQYTLPLFFTKHHHTKTSGSGHTAAHIPNLGRPVSHYGNLIPRDKGMGEPNSRPKHDSKETNPWP